MKYTQFHDTTAAFPKSTKEENELNINFNQLTMQGFKNHDSLTVLFSDVTEIEGRNGEGKSSVGDAVTWLLYGVDMNGNKLEPTPIGTNEDTKVELLLTVDDKKILLCRSLEKNRNDKLTAKFYVNEVPEKATKFDEVVSALFDKHLFLSLFNPSYFFTQHWEEQRAQFLRYVSEPSNIEVLETMNEVDRNLLADQLKKQNLDATEKVYRDTFNKADRELIAAQERVKTLQEQAQTQTASGLSETDKNYLHEQIARIEEELKEKQAQNNEIKLKMNALHGARQEKMKAIRKAEQERTELQNKMNNAKERFYIEKDRYLAIKEEVIADSCPTCGQSLDEEMIEKSNQAKIKRLEEQEIKVRDLFALHQTFKSQLDELPAIPELGEETETFELIDTSELQRKLYQLKSSLDTEERFEKQKANSLLAIDEAKTKVDEVKKRRNHAQAVIDAVKEFRSKRSELMVKKIKGMFTNISIILTHTQKNGEEKNTFDIAMNGKPYAKLSTAEKIRCGLELISAISQQADIAAPTFVDNAESVVGTFRKTLGQFIIARVKDTDFAIKNLEGAAING